jgi:hypothetical protein
MGYSPSTGAITTVLSGLIVSIEFQKRVETLGAVDDLISIASFRIPFVKIKSISAPLKVL